MAQLQREHGVAYVARQIRGVAKAGTGARIVLACTLLGVAAAFLLGVIGAAQVPVLIERAATSETQRMEAEGDDADEERAEAGADTGAEGDEIETVVVDVGGAVIEPGVVELDAGSRVADAIEAAGGPRNRCGLHHIEPGAASPGWSESLRTQGGRNRCVGGFG